jgi:hypothetical protein
VYKSSPGLVYLPKKGMTPWPRDLPFYTWVESKCPKGAKKERWERWMDLAGETEDKPTHRTHTHTNNIYIMIYIYIYMKYNIYIYAPDVYFHLF